MIDNLSVKHVYDEIERLLQHAITDLDVQNIDFDNIKTNMKNNKKLIRLLMVNQLMLIALELLEQNIQGTFFKGLHQVYENR